MRKYFTFFATMLLFTSCDFIADKMGYTPKSNDYNVSVSVKQEEHKESEEEASKRKYKENIASYVTVSLGKYYDGKENPYELICKNNTEYTIEKIVVKYKYYNFNSFKDVEETETFNYVSGKSTATIKHSITEHSFSNPVIVSIKCNALGL